MFAFHAASLDADAQCRRLSFEGEFGEEIDLHYFIMDRSEESPDEAVPDLGNIYIERDDQQFGGYGGIERVMLARNKLTLQLTKRMAVRMGRHDRIEVSFEIADNSFRELQNVLRLIMRGYESRVEAPVLEAS